MVKLGLQRRTFLIGRRLSACRNWPMTSAALIWQSFICRSLLSTRPRRRLICRTANWPSFRNSRKLAFPPSWDSRFESMQCPVLALYWWRSTKFLIVLEFMQKSSCVSDPLAALLHCSVPARLPALNASKCSRPAWLPGTTLVAFISTVNKTHSYSSPRPSSCIWRRHLQVLKYHFITESISIASQTSPNSPSRISSLTGLATRS